MAVTKKEFVLKMDLPGGLTKGTVINADKDGRKWVYTYNGKPFPYDCAKEPRFFEERPLSKYTKGTRVITDMQINAELCHQNGDKTRQHFKLPAYTEFPIVGERMYHSNLFVIVQWNGRWYLLPEKSIRVPEYYLYVNSSGKVFKACVGRDKVADKFRKETGNWHKDAQSAETYKNSLYKKA